jgi:hypothetical protein
LAVSLLTGLLSTQPVHGRESPAVPRYPTAQACKDELSRLTQESLQTWQVRLAEYYDRLTAEPEPRDDAGRAELWLAYLRQKQAHAAYVQLREQASCFVDARRSTAPQ